MNGCVSGMNNGAKIKFTPEEDRRLSSVVAEYGTKDWMKVACMLPGRNARQCRERYNSYLDPTLRNDPWTSEEDALLEQKHNELGAKWNKIAKFFVNRGNNALRNRAMILVRRRTRLLTFGPDPVTVTVPAVVNITSDIVPVAGHEVVRCDVTRLDEPYDIFEDIGGDHDTWEAIFDD